MSDIRPRIILIAGMHRSGTSALTRVLSLCGGVLPQTLFPAVEGDNDLGYWESAPLIALHQSILEELGTDMLGPGPVDPAWFDSPQARAARDRILLTVRTEWRGEGVWIVKEPRICRLMPLWRDVLLEMQASAAIVIPIREPGEVSRSLARRDGLRASIAERSWLAHVVGAERHTREYPRVIVTFDQLLDDWRKTVARIATLSRTAHGDASSLREADSEEDVAAFLRAGLRRHRCDELPADAHVRAVRSTMLDAAHGAIAEPDRSVLDRAWIDLVLRQG